MCWKEKDTYIHLWCQQMPKSLQVSQVKRGNDIFAIFLFINLYLNPDALGFGTINRLGWYPQNCSVTGIGPTTPWPRSLEKIWWGSPELCDDIKRLQVWNQGGVGAKFQLAAPTYLLLHKSNCLDLWVDRDDTLGILTRRSRVKKEYCSH